MVLGHIWNRLLLSATHRLSLHDRNGVVNILIVEIMIIVIIIDIILAFAFIS